MGLKRLVCSLWFPRHYNFNPSRIYTESYKIESAGIAGQFQAPNKYWMGLQSGRTENNGHILTVCRQLEV